jgi:heat shock protein HtpX
MKRIFLFVAVNFFVLITISIIIKLLGLGNYMTQAGIDYRGLMAFCLVWGMAGSFISLMLSKVMAKFAMGVQIIDPERPGQFSTLVRRTHELSRIAGLTKMPEVGVFENPSPNAFATGPSKRNSLVAVSTGLLNHMDQAQIDAVIAHEIAHIKNGDMVTMTLIQGVMNAFVMFFARVIAFGLSQVMRGNDRDSESSSAGMNYLVVFLLEMVLGLLSMFVICWFSRKREFRADAGSAKIMGSTAPMISALKALASAYDRNHQVDARQESLAAFQISGKSGGLMSLLATHPPLEVRIAALERSRGQG